MVVGKLNFKRMEELFCQKVPAPQGPRKEVDKKSKEPVAVCIPYSELAVIYTQTYYAVWMHFVV